VHVRAREGRIERRPEKPRTSHKPSRNRVLALSFRSRITRTATRFSTCNGARAPMDRFSACSHECTSPRQSRLARGSGDSPITRPRADPTRGGLSHSIDPRARPTRRPRPCINDENSFTHLNGHASTAHGRAEAQRRAHRSFGNDVSRCRARDADGARAFSYPCGSRWFYFDL